MSSEIRQKRVAGLLLDELRILIGSELNDPRLSMVTVTDVVVAKDLHNVKVFVNHDDDAISKRELLARLAKATPFLRSQIGERLTLRAVPELSFAYDESPARVNRLQELLQQIKDESGAPESAASGAAPSAAGSATADGQERPAAAP